MSEHISRYKHCMICSDAVCELELCLVKKYTIKFEFACAFSCVAVTLKNDMALFQQQRLIAVLPDTHCPFLLKK